MSSISHVERMQQVALLERDVAGRVEHYRVAACNEQEQR